jgi:hypothetical protein
MTKQAETAKEKIELQVLDPVAGCQHPEECFFPKIKHIDCGNNFFMTKHEENLDTLEDYLTQEVGRREAHDIRRAIEELRKLVRERKK